MPDTRTKLDNGSLQKPIIINSKHAGTQTCATPMCAACSLARMTRKTPDIRPTTTPHEETRNILKENNLNPGDCISLDHYESIVRDRLPHTQCHKKQTDQYSGGTIAVDHASGKMGKTSSIPEIR